MRETLHTIGDETKNLTEWCAQFSMPYTAIRYRLKKGMSIEDALILPIRQGKVIDMANVTIQRIEAEALPYGLHRTMAGPNHQKKWTLHCAACDRDTQFGFSQDMPPQSMVADVRKRGWDVSDKRPPRCPVCVELERQMSKVHIGPDPKLNRKIFQFLDDHFDETKRLYRAGWSDQKIADEIGTHVDLIIKTRREAYGELAEDPVVQTLRDDIALMRLELDELTSTFNATVAASLSKLSDLETRLNNHIQPKVA